MGKKSFEAGMEAGAKPFEEKFQKQAAAFDKTADRLDSKLDDIKGVTDALVDDGLARERKEIFGLNTLFDINSMEDTEKILVVSLLYTLAQRFEANDYQKNYIRSVQKYLGLKNIQPADTLTGVENVKDIDSQKAILQVVMEYLFLDGFSFDFLDDENYEELFDSFNINRKGFREVETAIENIYQAVGAEGIAEHFDFEQAPAVIQVPTLPTSVLTKVFNCNIYMLTKQEGGRNVPIFNNYMPIVAFDKIKSVGVLEFPDSLEMIMPGSNATININLESAIIMKPGDCFSILEGGKVVCTGTVVESLR